MVNKKGGPSVRSTFDSHAFMKEEKFDTWLDLGPLYELQKLCVNAPDWTKDNFSSINCVFSGDTLCLLKMINKSPNYIGMSIITPTLPAKILHYGLTTTINKCHMTPANFLTLYTFAAEAAKVALSKQVTHLMRNMSPELVKVSFPSLHVWDTKLSQYPSEMSNFAYIVEDTMRILEAYKALSEYRNESTARLRSRMRIRKFESLYGNSELTLELPSLKARIILSLDLSILIWGSETYLLTHKYLLEIVNKINETFCALLYSHMVSGTNLHTYHYNHVVNFLAHISYVVSSFCTYSNNPDNLFHENKAFTYLKVMEGLGVACIILREDKCQGWYNDDLIVQLWQSVVEEELQPRTSFDDSTLGRLLSDFPVSTIAEILGLVKLCGHPSIEIYRGLAKLKERTHAVLHVNPIAVNRTIGVMKRELVINFKRKRGKYPIIRMTHEDIPYGLKKLVMRNINPDSEEGIKLLSGVTIEHWALISLEKNEDFDPIDNQLVLLKDKALGLIRSKVMKMLLCKESADNSAGLGPIEERRALLSFLLNDHFSDSFREYLSRYEHDEVWTTAVFAYLVVKLTAKELEEKPDGRMFGASPAEERNRRVVQEENTMRIMDNYFKDQLMTPDELQMMRKLFSFRHFNKMYPHHKLLQVSFDFSKWNNNMRAESIDVPARETLDKWFGTKIFGKTMKAYESSLFYYKDMLREDHWEGQLGGIEGLNQATWSVIFLCGIKQALEGLGVIYQLTVKGDDVRAALVIPEREYRLKGIERIKISILSQLSLLCNDMGWQLNPHECFVSLSVISTSKQYQVQDTFLPAATKKIVKMESLSNLIFPTTEDMVASIFSTAHSACSQATAVLPAFASALYIACRLLKRELWSSGKLSIEDIAVLAMWPQCLGGPGSLPLQTFFVRGENDMLSVSISLLRSMITCDDNGLSRQVKNILSQQMKTPDDLTLLLSDPYSIPVNSPERPNAVLKRLMREHLPYWVRNPDLKTLLTMDASIVKKEFIEHISSMKPYYSKVATTLWETSPFYIIEEVLSKFMESSTIFSFFAKGKTGRTSTRSAHRALTRILIAAKKRKLYWVKVIKSCGFNDELWLGIPADKYLARRFCTTQLVHEVRKSAWGFEIKGITYPSLVDQNLYYTPSDMLERNPNWATSDVVTTILVEHKRAKPQTSDSSLHYSAAPGLAPWLGAQTSSKLELPNISTRITSPAINKIMRLINLKVNADILGPDFIKTVDMLISSLTGLNLVHLRELIPEAGGGHISHRVAINSFSTNTMPNSRPNLAQLVKLPSDAGAALRGDTTNRTVNFAARHFFSIVIALLPLQSQQVLPVNYPDMLYTLFHNDIRVEPRYEVCPWCCNDVDDGTIVFTNKQRPYLADFKYLSLVGCSEFEEKTLRKNMVEALTGKVRRTAYHEVQDVNDPTIINIASHILMKKLGKERLKIFEAAQGAQFACTPRAELLEIMSVAMGIKTMSSVSLNIIRLIPSANLYMAVMTEIFSFCLNWLAVSNDAENLYQVDNIMNHLNPLSSLFDSLISAQVLNKIREGAIKIGKLNDFKWNSSSALSGGAAMKCFFNYHKNIILKWIQGEEIPFQVHIFTNMETDETIHQALEREYRKLLQAAINRANAHYLNFRISSHWRRILNNLEEIEQYHNEFCDITGDPNFNLQSTYNDQVTEYISSHVIIDEIRQLTHMTDEGICHFWAYTFMCIHVERFLPRGEWFTDCNAVINTGEGFNICTIESFDDYNLSSIREQNLKETDFYEKWSGMFTSAELTYIHNIVSLQANIVPDMAILLFFDLYTNLVRWVSVVNSRQVMTMTQDNAELVLKKSNIREEDIIQEHLTMHHQIDMQACTTSMLRVTQGCMLGSRAEHRELRLITKPLLMKGTAEEIHVVHAGYVGLAYNDDPPPEQFFNDSTELLRGSGIHNTSVAKYLEIIYKMQLHNTLTDLGDDAVVLCMADGLGGVTARFLATYPFIQVVYNSMYYNTTTGQHAVDAHESIPPIEVSSLPHHLNALHRLKWKGMYPGDLTKPDVQNLIVSVTESCNRYPAIITMDADIPWHDNLATAKLIWFSALSIATRVLNNHTVCIFKCFCIHHPVVYEFCHTILALFSHVHLYRANYTRQRSTEFFIVFSEPRNKLTLTKEVTAEQYGEYKIARSLMISNYITKELDRIGHRYMDFRQLGKNHVIDIWHHLQTFIKSQAYPLDLTSCLMTLMITHPVPQGCLCALLGNVQLSATYSLNQANTNLRTLLIQARYRRIHKVGLSIGNKHDITSGWKGLQMSLRRSAKLQIIHDWLEHVLNHRGDPVLDWPKTKVDATYEKIYFMLDEWKGYIAPILVKNSLIVCCERFNDNWTTMMMSTLKKCQQMLGSILLLLGYVYKDKDRVESMTAYLSSKINIEECCRVHSTTLFENPRGWKLPSLAISLGAPISELLPSYQDIPDIQELLDNGLLERATRSYQHVKVEAIDPNLVEQINIILHQPDEELLLVEAEFQP